MQYKNKILYNAIQKYKIKIILVFNIININKINKIETRFSNMHVGCRFRSKLYSISHMLLSFIYQQQQ